MVKARGAGGRQEEFFGVGDDQYVRGITENLESMCSSMNFGTRNCLFARHVRGEVGLKLPSCRVVAGGNEPAAADHLARSVGSRSVSRSIRINGDVLVVVNHLLGRRAFV